MKRKYLILIFIFIVFQSFTILGQKAQQSKNNKQSNKSNLCDKNLWNFVYNPKRLRILNPCQVVTGRVIHIKKESDGDFHIQLKLDSQFQSLLNNRNIITQNGNLVLEIICANKITQKDAIEICKNYKNQVIIPKVGNYVEVIGPYIEDIENSQHGWREIHPVNKITVLK